MNDFNCTDGKKPLENGDFNSTFGTSAKKLKKTKKKAKDSSAVQEGAASSRGDEKQQQQEKKPPKKARKKVQKKSELLKTGCRVVRLWIAAEMTNEYQTDIVKAKRSSKDGSIKLILRASTIPGKEYILPTDGFTMMRSKTEPQKCFWVSVEFKSAYIGFLFDFPTDLDAEEFYDFVTAVPEVPSVN